MGKLRWPEGSPTGVRASPPKPRKTAWFSNNGIVVPPILSWLLPVTACVTTGAFVVQDMGPEASVSGGQWIRSGKPGKSSPEDESLRVSRCWTTTIGSYIGITNPWASKSCFWWLVRIRQCLPVKWTNEMPSGPADVAQCFPLAAAFRLFPPGLASGLLQ